MSLFGKGPLRPSPWKPLPENPLPYAGLISSVGEHAYDAEVVGKLPDGLRGSLYRNGPGLYDRGDMRKRMVLDGDGMVQAFHFSDGKVHYVNRFVRTAKFVEEEAAGRFTKPTWSTLAPGGPLNNLGAVLGNQAGVTTIRRGDRLFALDESAQPYELAPDDLRTVGLAVLDEQTPTRPYHAHWKLQARDGHWFLLSLVYGRRTVAEVIELGSTGAPLNRWRIPLERGVYMHDWFLTDSYFVFVLHPAYVGLVGYLKVMAGLDTFSEIIKWKPRQGNLVHVVPRHPGFAAHSFESEACWMWHACNSFEENGQIILDFVGSTEVGLGNALFDVMRGDDPKIPQVATSFFRRYVIDPANRRLRFESYPSSGNHELPFVSQARRGLPHRFVYAAKSSPGAFFWNRIERLEPANGTVAEVNFGEQYCGEPVFVPDEKRDAIEGGWILTQTYSPKTKTSALAVLDSAHLLDGPVATVQLTHHVPLSFHGYWHA